MSQQLPQPRSLPLPNGELNSGCLVIYLQSYYREDDVLILSRLKTGGYRSVFRNNTVGRIYEQYFEDEEAVIRYIDTFILIQEVDSSPYAYIQVDLPGMPTILMRNYRSDWNRIFNRVRDYLRDISTDSYTWPREYTIKSDEHRQQTTQY